MRKGFEFIISTAICTLLSSGISLAQSTCLSGQNVIQSGSPPNGNVWYVHGYCEEFIGGEDFVATDVKSLATIWRSNGSPGWGGSVQPGDGYACASQHEYTVISAGQTSRKVYSLLGSANIAGTFISFTAAQGFFDQTWEFSSPNSISQSGNAQIANLFNAQIQIPPIGAIGVAYSLDYSYVAGLVLSSNFSGNPNNNPSSAMTYSPFLPSSQANTEWSVRVTAGVPPGATVSLNFVLRNGYQFNGTLFPRIASATHWVTRMTNALGMTATACSFGDCTTEELLTPRSLNPQNLVFLNR